MTSTTGSPGPAWLKSILPRSRTATVPAGAPQPAPAIPAAAPLALLAAALRAPHGASPEELAAAIADNKARPDLDPELVDDDGFPITSARCDEAADEAIQEEIHEWLVLNGMAELQLGEAHWRALILGTAVVRDLAGEALAQLMPVEGAPSQLRLLAVLPSAWTVEQRHAAGCWFKHTVAQFGWPLDHLTRIDVARDATPASILAQCAADSQGPDSRIATLLVACDSHLDQETVDAWAANGSLSTPATPQGRIPGEGAAGLLLTSLEGARQVDAAVFAHLYPLVETRREVSIDSARRAQSKRITELAERAVHAGGRELTQVGHIAADTDQRIARSLELMNLASLALPQLDTTLDVSPAGVSLGSCGAVLFLCALALARHAALLNNAPALFMSNDDPFTCAMALVSPPPLPALPI
jgi:hypothetical protein